MNKIGISLWAIAMVCVLALSGLSLGVSAGGISHAPRIKIKDGSSSSTNWGGYAVTGGAGSVTDVKGSWIVPAVTCTSGNQYSSFWVGIDGYSSNSVEQTGTDSDCSGATPVYSAWYEYYPKYPVYSRMAIHPGDVMFAEVKYTGRSSFTTTLTDVTTGKSFSSTGKVPSAARSSAEWIMEAPYSGGVLPLANFGAVSFGQDYTGRAPTGVATIGSATGAIGSFPAASVQQIAMAYTNGTVKASPSVLTTDGTSFVGTWQQS